MTDDQQAPSEVRCAQCGTRLEPGQDREVTEGGTFCRSCFVSLTVQLQQVLDTQGQDVNYGGAIALGLLGAAAGALAWWAFTVATHIAFGSIRMEPVFMILGQSAGTAAALAIDGGTSIQDVPYEALRARLLKDGQVLER